MTGIRTGPARARGNTVLVVDDDVDMRESIRDVLVDEGYEVVTASNGKEALEFLPGIEGPCGVVLDVEMPVLDGRQFYEAMTAVPALAKTPVMVLTWHPTLAPAGVPRMRKTNLELLLTMVAALF